MKTIIQFYNRFYNRYNHHNINQSKVISMTSIFVVTIILNSCYSAPDTINNYYVTNNNIETTTPSANNSVNDDDSWVNPLNKNGIKDSSDKTIYAQNTRTNNIYASDGDNVVITNYYSNYSGFNTHYVPVISPWWNNWSVWNYRPYYRVGFGYGGFGGCVVYDWYSPFYDYHPYYGYSWFGRPSIGLWSWCYQPIYSYYPRRFNDFTYRRFGSNFDNYRYGNISSANNRVNSRNESNGNPMSNRYSSRNNAGTIYANNRNNSVNTIGSNRVIGTRTGYVTEPNNSRNYGNKENSNSNGRNVYNNGNNRNSNERNSNIYDNSGSSRNNGTIENTRNIGNNSNNNGSSRVSGNSRENVSPNPAPKSNNSIPMPSPNIRNSSPTPSSVGSSRAPSSSPSPAPSPAPSSGGNSRNGGRR